LALSCQLRGSAGALASRQVAPGFFNVGSSNSERSAVIFDPRTHQDFGAVPLLCHVVVRKPSPDDRRSRRWRVREAESNPKPVVGRCDVLLPWNGCRIRRITPSQLTLQAKRGTAPDVPKLDAKLALDALIDSLIGGDDDWPPL
jgi:hypothetical protein